jgi:carbon starvation protein CstA
VLLLLLTGTVFVNSPAALIARLTPMENDTMFWVIVILLYYVLATLLPIDKVIGKLYPVFGTVLIVMAVGILGGTIFGGYHVPELTLQNLHPSDLPVWPYMFVTVACGAVSGFHATQSPMVAKCITSEKEGRPVFYGAMICEAAIALVWAAAGVAYYGATQLLNEALRSGASNVVYEISTGVLGTAGGILAVVGVIVCPITSGDTAFRSARLILAETFGLDQKPIRNRLLITVPLLAVGGLMTWLAVTNGDGFQTVWRYFSWSNQTLAMIALWVAASYLLREGPSRYGSLVAALPAAFMTAVSSTYLLVSEEGFGLPDSVARPAGAVFGAVLFAVYLVLLARRIRGQAGPGVPDA